MKRFVALTALLLTLATSAKADTFNATIQSGNIGQNLSNGHYAGTFTVTGIAPPAGPFTAYCADLVNNVGFGTTPITGTIYYGTINPANVPGTIWGNSQFGSDVGNRINYLMSQIVVPGTLGLVNNSEGDKQAAAMQSSIWQTVSSLSAGANSGQPNTNPYAADIMQLVTGNSVAGSGWSLLNSVTAYDSNTTYQNPYSFLLVPASDNSNPNNNNRTYQVLVGVAVPEPSSLAIAGLGALGFLGYGLKRRKSV